MSTEKNVTPAQELRAAAQHLRTTADPAMPVAAELVAAWLEAVADECEHTAEPAVVRAEPGWTYLPESERFSVRPYHPTEDRQEVPSWNRALLLAREVNSAASEQAVEADGIDAANAALAAGYTPDPACECDGKCRWCAHMGCEACCDSYANGDHGVRENEEMP